MGLRLPSFARFSVCVAAAGIGLSGCTGQHGSLPGATASLGASVKSFSSLSRPGITADEQKSREDAIIAQAIAAHEMRNP